MPRIADGPLGEFKSSPTRLARLFLQSRDVWKKKCSGAKSEVKILKNRVRFLEETKAALKDKNRQLKAEADRLRAALAAKKKDSERKSCHSRRS